MIKENEIILKISPSNYKRYVEKYGPFKCGDAIKIDINDLSKNSVTIITAICKTCGMENEIRYQNYNVQIKRGGYYCCKNCSINKNKKTNMLKYGSEYPQQNKTIREKSIVTIKKNYGVDNPSKIHDIKMIRKKRLLDKEYQEKMKNSIIEKYNVENVSKLEEIKNKKKETCLKNYGVENPMQNENIFIKSQKSGKKLKYHKKTNLYYRGTYEKDFLDFCYKNNIKVSKGKTIEFIYENKKKIYYSDFFIEDINTIIEIKSTYYYNKYKKLNDIKKYETIKQNMNFIMIVDKEYDEFISLLN